MTHRERRKKDRLVALKSTLARRVEAAARKLRKPTADALQIIIDRGIERICG